MFTRNRRGQRNQRNRVMDRRTVGNMLRQFRLTSQPAWSLMRNARNITPPPLVNDVSYVRKVRLYSTAAATVLITTSGLNSTIFPSSVPFSSVCVTAIEAWGPTVSQVTITPDPGTVQGSSASAKEFSDVGAFGSRPAHVRIVLSSKDAVFLSTTASIPVAAVRTLVPSTPVPGDSTIVIDVTCMFSGTADVELTSTQSSSRSNLPNDSTLPAPMDWDASFSDVVSNPNIPDYQDYGEVAETTWPAA